MLFSEYAEEWKRDARLNVSDGWKKTQDMMLREHIIPYLGNKELTEIGHLCISKTLSAGISKGHAPNTVKQTYLLLSKMFNDAVFFGHREKSPVVRRLHFPKAPKKERPYLLPDEAQKLIEYAKYHWSIQAIVIQIFLGLRAGEVIGLKWRSICFETSTLRVVEKWNRKTKTIDQYTKNKKDLVIPFSGKIRDFLLDLKKTMNPSDDDFVCAGPDGRTMMSYLSYQKAIIYLCKGAGIKRVSSHAFRHTCSTLWRRAGASNLDIQQLLNHEDEESTKTYIHDDFLRLRKIADDVMNLSLAI